MRNTQRLHTNKCYPKIGYFNKPSAMYRQIVIKIKNQSDRFLINTFTSILVWSSRLTTPYLNQRQIWNVSSNNPNIMIYYDSSIYRDFFLCSIQSLIWIYLQINFNSNVVDWIYALLHHTYNATQILVDVIVINC